MKQRRKPTSDTGKVFNEDSDDKSYQRYKHRCYRNLVSLYLKPFEVVSPLSYAATPAVGMSRTAGFSFLQSNACNQTRCLFTHETTENGLSAGTSVVFHFWFRLLQDASQMCAL